MNSSASIPGGPHVVRVRASARAIDPGPAEALESSPPSPQAEVPVDGVSSRLVNGRLTVDASAHGRLRFLHTGSGRELLADKTPYTRPAGPRVHAAGGRTEQHFEAYDGERLHGLGQHLHGRLDQKGCVIDLVQGDTVAAVPFLHSSRGYGLQWNSPATGRVELAADTTRGPPTPAGASTTGSPPATLRPRSWTRTPGPPAARPYSPRLS
jgi:alpha-D-xyloside xylohydrolase